MHQELQQWFRKGFTTTVTKQKPVIKRNPSPACYQHTQRIRYYISAVAAYLVVYGRIHASSCTYAYLKLAASAMRSNAVPSIISKTVRLTEKKRIILGVFARSRKSPFSPAMSVRLSARINAAPGFSWNLVLGTFTKTPENPNLVKIVRKYRALYTKT